jgi:hypothetical protein
MNVLCKAVVARDPRADSNVGSSKSMTGAKCQFNLDMSLMLVLIHVDDICTVGERAITLMGHEPVHVVPQRLAGEQGGDASSPSIGVRTDNACLPLSDRGS